MFRLAKVTMSTSDGALPLIASQFSTKLPSMSWNPDVMFNCLRRARYDNNPFRMSILSGVVPNLEASSVIVTSYGDTNEGIVGSTPVKGGNTLDMLNAGINPFSLQSQFMCQGTMLCMSLSQ